MSSSLNRQRACGLFSLVDDRLVHGPTFRFSSSLCLISLFVRTESESNTDRQRYREREREREKVRKATMREKKGLERLLLRLLVTRYRESFLYLTVIIRGNLHGTIPVLQKKKKKRNKKAKRDVPFVRRWFQRKIAERSFIRSFVGPESRGI